MKLEVGMYVRTNKGSIDKIDDKNIMMYEVSLMGFGEKPIKASHNIIDLIEVGDYVNGLRVMKSSRGLFVENYYVDGSGCDISRLNIKTIVTKEQFESMSYSLEKESDK